MCASRNGLSTNNSAFSPIKRVVTRPPSTPTPNRAWQAQALSDKPASTWAIRLRQNHTVWFGTHRGANRQAGSFAAFAREAERVRLVSIRRQNQIMFPSGIVRRSSRSNIIMEISWQDETILRVANQIQGEVPLAMRVIFSWWRCASTVSRASITVPPFPVGHQLFLLGARNCHDGIVVDHLKGVARPVPAHQITDGRQQSPMLIR